MNKYSYTYNNPLRYVDPDGHGVFELLAGAADAFRSNEVGGLGRTNSQDRDFKIGQAIGDEVSFVKGVGETVLGAGGEVLGAGLDLTGGGAVLGVPINVASGALIADGVVSGTSGAVHLLKAAGQRERSKLRKYS